MPRYDRFMFLPDGFFRKGVLCLATGLLAFGTVTGLAVTRGQLALLWILMSLGIACLLGGLVWKKMSAMQIESWSKQGHASRALQAFCMIPLLLQALTLLTLLHLRTDRAIASPWEVVPLALFVLYGLSFFTVFLVIDEGSPIWEALLLGAQGFLATGVSWIIYRLGFGYDPFVHQAAERYLVAHETLSPPSVLYAGYYGFIVGVSRLVRLDPAVLDRALLPLAAPFILTLVAIFIWPKWLGRVPRRAAFLAVWLMPFLPLTFSVPHNLTYLLLFVGIFLLPLFFTHQFLWLGGGMAFFTLLIHPLLGVPLTTLVLSAAIAKRRPRFGVVIAAIGPFIGLIGAFLVYVHTAHGGVLSLDAPRLQRALITVFGTPAFSPQVSWWWKVLYGFFTLWPWCFMAIGYYGLRFLPVELRSIRRLLLATAGSLALLAVVLAACIRIPNILPSEQFEFALRLRYTLPLFFLPGVMLFLDERMPTVLGRKVLVGLCLASLAPILWYYSYPQYNSVINRSSPGLGRGDLAAVRVIERWAAGKPYVALTPQMVSAGALSLLGFERELQTIAGPRYPYPIPTGGELYQKYLRFWYQPDCHVLLKDVFTFAPVAQGFVVIPHTWDPRGVVRLRVDRCAEAREVVEGMTVFRVRP